MDYSVNSSGPNDKHAKVCQPTVSAMAERLQHPAGTVPIAEIPLPGGTPWMACYKHLQGYLVRVLDKADFEISVDGSHIAIHPVPGVSPETVEHLYLNQALPLALSLQKKLVLHGSAVEIAHTAVAFFGAAGRGKSTLAASFASTDAPFLTDDSLIILQSGGDYIVQPSHASLRLWKDSCMAIARADFKSAPAIEYNTKVRVLADRQFSFCPEPRPLSRGYFLGDGRTDTVDITAISPRDCVIELIRHCFLLGVRESEVLACNLKQISRLAENIPFFRLDYPRRYDWLAHVRERVCEPGHVEEAAIRQAS